jgi:hypothetical protein
MCGWKTSEGTEAMSRRRKQSASILRLLLPLDLSCRRVDVLRVLRI